MDLIIDFIFVIFISLVILWIIIQSYKDGKKHILEKLLEDNKIDNDTFNKYKK